MLGCMYLFNVMYYIIFIVYILQNFQKSGICHWFLSPSRTIFGLKSGFTALENASAYMSSREVA